MVSALELSLSAAVVLAPGFRVGAAKPTLARALWSYQSAELPW